MTRNGEQPRFGFGPPIPHDAPEPRPSPAADWELRLRETMFERRIVQLRGSLEPELAGRVALELMSLDATGDEHVTLYIDSATGTLEAAFMVIDVIDLLGVPVHATCLGRAEGPAVAVLAVCDRRGSAPHASFRLCEPVSEAHGNASDMQRFAEQQRQQLERFIARLAEITGRPSEHIEADLSAGRYLDAREALEYGLVDEIWTPKRSQPTDLDREPFGFRPPTRPHLSAYEEKPRRQS
jgi:ATP-dependent Clp protease, protease subunit